MKCAPAVIRSRSVRYVCRSMKAVNHAGTDGVSKETIQTGRLPTRPLPSTRAFVTGPPQVAWGTRTAVDSDSAHRAPGFNWSQRRDPITIPDAPPPWIRYERRSGASKRQVVRRPFVGPERSDSRYTRLRSRRKARAARVTIAMPGRVFAGTRNATEPPARATSIRRREAPEGTSAL